MYRVKTPALALFATLALFLALAPAAQAADDYKVQEVSTTVFYAWSSDLDDDNTLYLAGMMGSCAWHIVHNPSFVLDFRLDGELGYFWDYDTGWEFAILPGLRAYFGDWSVRPYLEGGIGPSFNTLDVHELGTSFNFLSFGGAGLRINLGEGSYLDLGYRFRHISNAGLDERNSGINHHVAMVGMSWDF